MVDIALFTRNPAGYRYGNAPFGGLADAGFPLVPLP